MEGLKEILEGKTCLVVGVGNSQRGDDGIGPYVLSRLDTKNKVDCGMAPENFTGRIRAYSAQIILIVDAVDFGGGAGESIISEAEKAKGVVLSTHSLPLSLFCMLFPESSVYLLGIQPADFTRMSRKTKAAGKRLARELNSLIK